MSASAACQLVTLSLHAALPISLAHTRELVGQPWSFEELRGLVQAIEKSRCVEALALWRERWAAELEDQGIFARLEAVLPDFQEARSEEHTSGLQSPCKLVCRLRLPASSSLFPYTPLFRSRWRIRVSSSVSRGRSRSCAAWCRRLKNPGASKRWPCGASAGLPNWRTKEISPGWQRCCPIFRR